MDVERLVARLREALAPVDALRVAWLFGSRATGRARPDSDLDVAVAFAPVLGEAARHAALRAGLDALAAHLGALGERVDLVDVDAAPGALGFAALRAGRRVLERSTDERVAAEVRILRRYDDEAPRRALFRRAAARAFAAPGERR